MTVPLMHAAGPWPWIAPLWILFWIGIVFLVLRFTVWRRRAWCGPRSATGGADGILAERFARGEIDAAEYQSRRETLRQ
ncbi:MAG: SHOCT domain-containing protein [Leifsonia sp.]